jgi:MFS family permease
MAVRLFSWLIRPDLISADDGNLISGLQAFDSWQTDLDFPTGARLGLLNAIGYIAGFFVGPVINYIDDNFGRKWGIRCKFKYAMFTESRLICFSLWDMYPDRVRHWVHRGHTRSRRLCG